MKELAFRSGKESDLPLLKELFYETITSVCAKDYTAEQIKVWSSSIEKEERWLGIVRDQYMLLAEKDGEIVGFITLENSNYVDFIYVHKEYQGQKIAQQLYQKVEEEAKREGTTILSSDVSITARPFFERMGFEVLKEQRNERKGVALNNYKMSKTLLLNQ